MHPTIVSAASNEWLITAPRLQECVIVCKYWKGYNRDRGPIRDTADERIGERAAAGVENGIREQRGGIKGNKGKTLWKFQGKQRWGKKTERRMERHTVLCIEKRERKESLFLSPLSPPFLASRFSRLVSRLISPKMATNLIYTASFHGSWNRTDKRASIIYFRGCLASFTQIGCRSLLQKSETNYRDNRQLFVLYLRSLSLEKQQRATYLYKWIFYHRVYVIYMYINLR